MHRFSTNEHLLLKTPDHNSSNRHLRVKTFDRTKYNRSKKAKLRTSVKTRLCFNIKPVKISNKKFMEFKSQFIKRSERLKY